MRLHVACASLSARSPQPALASSRRAGCDGQRLWEAGTSNSDYSVSAQLPSIQVLYTPKHSVTSLARPILPSTLRC